MERSGLRLGLGTVVAALAIFMFSLGEVCRRCKTVIANLVYGNCGVIILCLILSATFFRYGSTTSHQIKFI
jgi:hypothetical protein